MAAIDTGCRVRAAARRALVLLAAVLPLAACQADRTATGSVSAYAAPEQVVLDLPVRPGGLTAPEYRATSDFVAAYQAEGQGALEVMVPQGSAEAQAHLVVGQVRHVAREHGVPDAAVVYTSYHSKAAYPPVALRYRRGGAVQAAAECGRWPSNLASDWKNETYENFGCATASNLAAMVEDPGDLHGPRPMAPRDAERRDTVFENYRTGETTAAESKTDNAVTASDVGE